jgi:hypothetical protein
VRRAIAPGFALVAVAAFVVALAAGIGDATAKARDARVESSWTHPDYARFGVDRIAMIPAASYDENLPAQKEVEGAFGAALRETDYRWISVTGTRNLLRANGADSLLAELRESVLDRGFADSLDALAACAVLRCDALLSVRVDQWEQREVEWNQSGKPSTSVRLTAALVDSTGTLLWRASESRTGEGPYHTPEPAAPGGQDTGVRHTVRGGQGGAPSYSEVMEPIIEEWAKAFPARAATGAPAGGASPGTPDR